MKYVFGPVPSRRLGRSLGVDPVPLKTCNWNCVYCQLGRSVPMVSERREYAPTDDILAEIAGVLAQRGGEIDWITFAGSGEPLLHSGIGDLIDGVKRMTKTPVAVLTNGSFLDLPEVRRAVLPADAVLPSVDAGSAELFKKLDRPHPSFSFDRHVEGLVEFRKAYRGAFWPEVVLVRGVNDTERALEDIAAVLRRLRPDVVHINIPTRPPAEAWVEPPDDEGLMRASAILGRVAPAIVPGEASVETGGFESLGDAIIEIVSRHPMREEEIRRALGRWTADEVSAALAEAASSGRVRTVERLGACFFAAAGSRYSQKEPVEGGPERHERG
jgi:wyosine [tRNA(Phe)-imidazoG37] synthetase (radical SAM superfamily)